MSKDKTKAPEGANVIKNVIRCEQYASQVDCNTKMAVLSMLTHKPQDRHVLAGAIGISERTFRAAVRELRLEGNPIITDSHGGGYRLGTKSEAAATAREMRSRAYDMLRTAKALDGIDPDQMTIDEIMEGE